MSKYIVKIRPETDWAFDWEENICADFEENVVIVGRRNYSSDWEKASWWESVNELLDDIDNCSDMIDFIGTFERDYAADKLEEIYTLYYAWDGRDETEFKAKIAMLLYPGLDLTVSTLHGGGQGDWQEVVYITDSVDEGILEDWYTGDVYDIRLYEISDEDFAEIESSDEYDFDDDLDDILFNYGNDIDGALLSYHELRDIQDDSDTQEQGFIKYFGLPEDSDITVVEDY